MQPSEAKSKIGHEIYQSFVTSLSSCQTMHDLIQPSRTMMEQITAIVMQKYRINFTAIPKDMP
jgi:hypothetical protein